MIPGHGSSHSSIVAIVDGFARLSRDIRLHSKLVKEDIKSLVFVFRQANKTVIERKRSILHFFENGLKDDDIFEGRLHLEEVHTRKEGIRVWNDVMSRRE